MHNEVERVTIVSYKGEWPTRFINESKSLRSLISAYIEKEIEHGMFFFF